MYIRFTFPTFHMSRSTICCQFYTFDPRPNYPLLITAKRYWQPSSLLDPAAVTLVLTHGNGFHKEHWEPAIDELYSLFDEGKEIDKIREVWSIDAPNHGDAAVLNEETLRFYLPTCMSNLPVFISHFRVHSNRGFHLDASYPPRNVINPLFIYLKVAWEEYARSIHAFLAGLGTGVDVDFSTHRLVAIGHSMGAASL